jgi:peptidoglycan/xylan/chitin deacetylase (PgdA/CDA1 family)
MLKRSPLTFLIAIALFTFTVFTNLVLLQAQATVKPRAIVGDGTLRRIQIPILMYHYVSPLPQDADNIRIDLTIEPDIFRSHMDYLKQEGYVSISLYEMHKALINGTSLPNKPIILTFDDGHIDHYTNVLPILQEFDFIGTFFVITGRTDAGDPNYMSWSQIHEMELAGMNMESHTKSHFDLRERSYDYLVYEVLGSIESLAVHTGKEPHMFSYPSGRYDTNTLNILRTLPVWRAVTTQHGTLHTTDNNLELPRLRISGNMSVSGLAHLLNSAH